MITSSFGKKNRVSPLEQAQVLKRGDNTKKERASLAPILPLVSLIDAFCIIVIYLLVATQSGGVELNTPDSIHLPVAASSTSVNEAPVVRIQNGVYFINDVAVAQQALGQKLAELKGDKTAEQAEILIQADQAMTYAQLDPLIKAGSEAGIQKLKFAVLPVQ